MITKRNVHKKGRAISDPAFQCCFSKIKSEAWEDGLLAHADQDARDITDCVQNRGRGD
jgi:hypothetical protein